MNKYKIPGKLKFCNLNFDNRHVLLIIESRYRGEIKIKMSIKVITLYFCTVKLIKITLCVKMRDKTV